MTEVESSPQLFLREQESLNREDGKLDRTELKGETHHSTSAMHHAVPSRMPEVFSYE